MDSNFIIIFTIISFMFFLVFTEIKYKSIFELNIIYSLLWIIMMIVSKYNNLGLVKPRVEIYLFISISIIIINIIFIFIPIKTKNKDMTNYSNYLINYKKVFILNIIAYILFIPSIISALKILFTNGLNLLLIRNTVYVGITEMENAAIYSAFFRTIPTAIFIFVELISSYNLINRENKKMIYIGLADMIVGTFIFGGRNFVLYYAIFCLFHYINIPNKNKIKIKKRYFLYFILLLLFITTNRDVNNISFVQTIILYYAGSLSFLEVIFSNPTLYGLNVCHYGLLTFGFITEPIILVLKTIFRLNIKVPSYYFNIYAQQFVNIGENKYMLYNNNSTFFYPFALDFGKDFLLLGATIFFFIILFVLNQKNKGKLFFYFVYIYLSAVIVNSSVSYGLIGLSSAIIFILMWYCVERKEKSEANTYEKNYIT